VVAQTVQTMGYEVLEVEYLAHGLLRVTIDWPYETARESGTSEHTARLITIEDCEKVTRQLQFVLEVESVDYARLEVGSAGLDRRMYKPSDFDRFAGCQLEVVLKTPPIAAIQAGVLPALCASRKKYQGVLDVIQPGQSWQVQWDPQTSGRPTNSRSHLGVSKKQSLKRQSTAVSPSGDFPKFYAVTFAWTDVQEARLIPDIDFSRSRRKSYES
jgi:ribosome maturation factor RimP